MKIAICDDQEQFRSDMIAYLKRYAETYKKLFFYYEYRNGSEMLASAVDFDLIFVDYMMTDLNGVDTIAQLRERNVNTHVIFFSSFPEVVFDTFSVNAFRFLIKPVEYPKFEEAMHAYFRDIEQYKTIVISNNHNSMVYNVPEDEIIYAQADNVYTQVFTVREAYTYTGTLSAFEKLLSEGMFFRTHRSYVVNMRYVERFTKSTIHFTTGEKAPIAHTRYKLFFQTYCDFIKEKGRQML